MMKTAVAFAPAHISGLFDVRDNENPLHKGSRGAGVCLAVGVRTEVALTPSRTPKVSVTINQQPHSAEVSRDVARQFQAISKETYEAVINHTVDVPIGSGFGTSGAAALSLALALNEAAGTGLTTMETGQIAHRAEINCHTGLGTVLAESIGGFEIRRKPGAPGIGVIEKIVVDTDAYVFSLHLGPLLTKRFLTDAETVKRINTHAHDLIEKVLHEPTLKNFLYCSREFSDRINLYTPRLRAVMNQLNKVGVNCLSMNIFGEALFSVGDKAEMLEVAKAAGKIASSKGKIILTKIDSEGARIVD